MKSEDQYNFWPTPQPPMATSRETTYEALAQWLGIDALAALVPYTRAQVTAALAVGDEHLDTLPLVAWGRQHGNDRDDALAKHNVMFFSRYTTAPAPEGVWGLVREAIRRDRAADRVSLRTAWSLSDTVCVLKHVARFYRARVSLERSRT